MPRKLVTPELTTVQCKQFNDRESDTEIYSLGRGLPKLNPLAVGNNGDGKISCCFFGDILIFCSTLAYISIHNHSIGRKVTC